MPHRLGPMELVAKQRKVTERKKFVKPQGDLVEPEKVRATGNPVLLTSDAAH